MPNYVDVFVIVLIVQKWYWCGQSTNVVSVDDNAEDQIDYGDAAAFFEPDVSNRNIGIKIRNLTKVFLQNVDLFICRILMLLHYTVSA